MDGISEIFAQLDAYCRAEDYRGWDPFDGLNSKLFQCSGLHHSWFARLAWLQLFKRLPVNLRPLTMVPKVENAKALALFMRSALLQGERELADSLMHRILALRSDRAVWGEASWGYPFDWQAKAFFVPKGTPNVITTSYVLRGLLAMPEQDELGDIAVKAADFVQRHLVRERDGKRFIAYIPNSDVLVYNASLWGAWICMEAYRANQDVALKRLAEDAITNALSAQQQDGSWRYGTEAHHQFIDGFHTGYNLEALYLMNQQLGSDEISQAIERGMALYLAHCFEADGTAKYYATNRYPLDPHSAAQGIVTLLTLDAQRYRPRAQEIAQAAIRTLWNDNKGRFIYQQTKHYRNAVPYMRWTQAWMHLALAMLTNR